MDADAALDFLADRIAQRVAERLEPRTDAVLDLAEMAHRLHEPETTVRTWCRDGEIPATKCGRSWFITERRWTEHFSGKGTP